jgi:hypothetical protein
MSRTLRRAVLAFLLAPLAGVGACWLLMVVFGIPPDVSRAPVYFLIFYMPFLAGPIYAFAWIVGLPAYLVLHLVHRVRARYFVLLYTLAGGAIMSRFFWSRPQAPTWILIGMLMGVATGATFARLLLGPPVVPDVAA